MSHVACTGGKQQTAATTGVVIMANIPLDADGHPHSITLFLYLPDCLREIAFIDRIHDILPGWKLRRIQEEAISDSVGFKADFFNEVLHNLRHQAGYEEYIKAHGQILGTQDIRDRNAVIRLILFHEEDAMFV